jgi:hypothetical protein
VFIGILLHFYKTAAGVLGLCPTEAHIPFWDLNVISSPNGFEIRSIHEKGETHNDFKGKRAFFY